MGYDLCWLPFLPEGPDAGALTPLDMARSELAMGLRALGESPRVDVETLGEGEGYEIARGPDGLVIRAGASGALYGAYALLMALAAGEDPLQAWTEPCHALRMLNHWDNMDGRVERGYAGGSLFFRDGMFAYDENRLRQYGRMLASVGVNTVSLNNVNVRPPADGLITQRLLPDLKRVADLLRPFGVRLLAAVDYALPVACGLPTADPLDGEVQAFWQRQAALVYDSIPDLRGFLVKADSEFRPGPHAYGRNHAEGARPLARALKPYGGVVVWRCFVYNCRQDWRDTGTDRPRAAYDTYVPLEGQFDDNVILQVKNGPYDFQPREPVSPLLYAMPATVKALELQLAQEYTGQQIDLYYMPPQWREIRADLKGYEPRHICAVSNLGDDPNWTGHALAQVNLFAYGLSAWFGDVDGEAAARRWIRLTYGPEERIAAVLLPMLLESREIYESYAAPLGLGWMVNVGHHYGPSPEGYEYSPWGTYLRANRDAIGVDRTESGTGYAAQYPPALARRYSDPSTCPEALLLFFHRLPYGHRLPSGETLVQRVYDLHFEGAERAEGMAAQWETLYGLVPADVYENVRERLARQVENARMWRDVVNTYFYRYSGVPDSRGRTIYA